MATLSSLRCPVFLVWLMLIIIFSPGRCKDSQRSGVAPDYHANAFRDPALLTRISPSKLNTVCHHHDVSEMQPGTIRQREDLASSWDPTKGIRDRNGKWKMRESWKKRKHAEPIRHTSSKALSWLHFHKRIGSRILRVDAKEQAASVHLLGMAQGSNKKSHRRLSQ